jgi:hypothetical protein
MPTTPDPADCTAARVLITARSQCASPKGKRQRKGQGIRRTSSAHTGTHARYTSEAVAWFTPGRNARMTQHNDGTNLDHSRRSLGAKIKS